MPVSAATLRQDTAITTAEKHTINLVFFRLTHLSLDAADVFNATLAGALQFSVTSVQ